MVRLLLRRAGAIPSSTGARKYDMNNCGYNPVHTDMIGASWDYPEANYSYRKTIWQEHVDYTRGFLWCAAPALPSAPPPPRPPTRPRSPVASVSSHSRHRRTANCLTPKPDRAWLVVAPAGRI